MGLLFVCRESKNSESSDLKGSRILGVSNHFQGSNTHQKPSKLENTKNTFFPENPKMVYSFSGNHQKRKVGKHIRFLRSMGNQPLDVYPVGGFPFEG